MLTSTRLPHCPVRQYLTMAREMPVLLRHLVANFRREPMPVVVAVRAAPSGALA